LRRVGGEAHGDLLALQVHQAFVGRAAAALASTIIVMAHSLDKTVIAEGVETADQLEYLREHGCDLAQGYFLARPLSALDMTAMLLGQVAVGDAARSAVGA
jgi:EAL domain-containing protein (putative c-di-GMP-specific phosphodiesterase class I)